MDLSAWWRGGDQRAWPAIAVGLTAAALLLVGFRGRFHNERELADVPAIWLAAGLVGTGLLFLGLLPLIRSSARWRGRKLRGRLAFIIVTGLVLRLLMFWSTPALEDDFNRYLWDGAVTAHGYNPYAIAPSAAGEDGPAPRAIKDLAEAAGTIHALINHPDLRTIYPPVAQGAFTLAYLAEPWSLISWRMMCLGGDIATLALLLALLRVLNRSALWSAVYWWNPVVIKELFNSAHMEAILMPLVLAALLLSLRRRPIAATVFLTLAAGAKLWPVILAPLLWRGLVATPRTLALAVAILGGGCATWAYLPLTASLGETSGFVAYATHWQTNSALLPAVMRVAEFVGGPLPTTWLTAGLAARLFLGFLLVVFIAWTARAPVRDHDDLVRRVTVTIGALYILSPAQFPWYLVWLQPFLALYPIRGWLIATPLVPVYYASFYFHSIGSYWIFRDIIVWAIWLPIWATLAHDARAQGNRPRADGGARSKPVDHQPER